MKKILRLFVTLATALTMFIGTSTVVFANNSFISALLLGATSGITTTVNTESQLLTALNNASTSQATTIQLTANITMNSRYDLKSGQNITLDLNGHSLTVGSGVSGTLFTVGSGTSLTLTDSKQPTETVTNSGNQIYGNAATATNNGGTITLTYYVTETTVTDSLSGTTSEILKEHMVTTSGVIINSGNKNVVSVSGGTFNMTGGMICGGGAAAIQESNGTINFSDGYICGVSNNINNGAVNMTNGTLNISDSAVMAANISANNGAAVYATAGTVNMTGGIISGNTASYNGGGIFIKNSGTTVNMSGGYLTNNIATDASWASGGGGAFIDAYASFLLSGGYITGNQAAGGGGISTSYNSNSSFGTTSATNNYGSLIVTGGFITANCAKDNEGGGLTIRDHCYASISAGYITNNIMNSADDWGGGGIFIGQDGLLETTNVMITDNSSSSYGGGIAGCSTGYLYVYTNSGAAIYGNTSAGENVYNGAKPEGYNYTYNNTVFQTQYANNLNSEGTYNDDYFCVNSSAVMGAMLAGGAQNWAGSGSSGSGSPEAVISATKPETVGINDFVQESSLLALTATPSAESIAAAQGVTKVYINGNYSASHAGGIMANGNLVIGIPSDVVAPVKLAIEGTKICNDASGNIIALTDGNGFIFQLIDWNTGAVGNVVANGTCDATGKIVFDNELSFSNTGTYVYHITEVNNGMAYKYDKTEYVVNIVVQQGTSTPLYTASKVTNLKIASIRVTKNSGLDVAIINNPTATNQKVILGQLDGKISFTNTKQPATSVAIHKTWNNCIATSNIQVQLYADGNVYGNPVTISASDTIETSDGSTLDWFYNWKNLPQYRTDANGNLIKDGSGNYIKVVYTVQEVPISGYESSITAGTIPTHNVTTTTTSVSWTRIYNAANISVGDTILFINGSWMLYNNNGVGNWMASNATNPDPRAQWTVTDTATGLYYNTTNGVTANNSGTVSYYLTQGYSIYKKITTTSSSTKVENVSDKYFVITNTAKAEKKIDMTLMKKNSSGTVLSGAKFTLYRVDETGVTVLYTDANGYKTMGAALGVSQTTAADGTVKYIELTSGTYCLKEDQAPSGYVELKEPIFLTVNADTGTITISTMTNVPEASIEKTTLSVINRAINHEIPNTGGLGVFIYTGVGLLLMIVASLRHMYGRYS